MESLEIIDFAVEPALNCIDSMLHIRSEWGFHDSLDRTGECISMHRSSPVPHHQLASEGACFL